MIITIIVHLTLLTIAYLFASNDFVFKEVPKDTLKGRVLCLTKIILFIITIYIWLITALIKLILVVLISIIFYIPIPVIATIALFYWLVTGKNLLSIYFNYYSKLREKIWS